MAVFAISDIVVWAKITQYLSEADQAKQRLLKGGVLSPHYPLLMAMESEILEFMNNFSPSNENIDKVANYVYHLCGRYLAEAKVIAGQGGGGIVIPGTGISATIGSISIEFELGVTVSPVSVNGININLPVDGDNEIILPFSNIMDGSLLLTIGGVPQPTIETTNSTYTSISYTSSQAIITLGPSGTQFQNGNTYTISGLQFVRT